MPTVGINSKISFLLENNKRTPAKIASNFLPSKFTNDGQSDDEEGEEEEEDDPDAELFKNRSGIKQEDE